MVLGETLSCAEKLIKGRLYPAQHASSAKQGLTDKQRRQREGNDGSNINETAVSEREVMIKEGIRHGGKDRKIDR